MSFTIPLRSRLLARPTTAAATTVPQLLRPQCLATGSSTTRAFTTSPSLHIGKGYPRQGEPKDWLGMREPIPLPHAKTPHIPAYPYGPRHRYRQSNIGLYGQARMQFGHKISERNKHKNPRKWRPNVHRRRLWSASLRCFVQTRITTRVLRTIDKVGGLDEYLLGEKTQRIKDLGPWGWKLRWRVMQSDDVKIRFMQQRRKYEIALRNRWGKNTLLGVSENGTNVLPPKDEPLLLVAGVPGVPEGTTVKQLMNETQLMLESGEDIPLGDPNDEDPKDEGFMREEPPRL